MPILAGEGRVEKRFRVAREGQTVDGRELARQEIQEMAASYNLEHYAGRINLEHWSGFSPDPPFNAYGDIIKVEAIEENGLMCLYNTISALPNLIEMNKNGQKIYPSIEFYRNFAGTGKAYQVGLALTDTPASLGTQPLKLSQQNYALRTDVDKEIYMSANTPQDENKSFLQQLKELMTPQSKAPEKQELDDTVAQAVVFALNGIKDLATQLSQLKEEIGQKLETLSIGTTQPPATQPSVTQPTTTEAPVDQMTAMQEQLVTLQQQLQTLSITPVNTPPIVAGPTGDVTPY